ncbi:hypothetical protein [Streptomyces jeddahensis]|uniref:Uncharacterized protein n=1 Tax=Streptomyces jeddahensis TaxID=1716141 RepID=A0A177HY51_9ACTN|nr:hypothetical protein STSP_16670 [Streptomyces jeddahensis]
MARTSPSWYEHSIAYVLTKWPRAAAKHRASIAESLAVVTPTFVTTKRATAHRRGGAGRHPREREPASTCRLDAARER